MQLSEELEMILFFLQKSWIFVEKIGFLGFYLHVRPNRMFSLNVMSTLFWREGLFLARHHP